MTDEARARVESIRADLAKDLTAHFDDTHWRRAVVFLLEQLDRAEGRHQATVDLADAARKRLLATCDRARNHRYRALGLLMELIGHRSRLPRGATVTAPLEGEFLDRVETFVSEALGESVGP